MYFHMYLATVTKKNLTNFEATKDKMLERRVENLSRSRLSILA